MREAYPANEVGTEQGEDDYPQGKEHFTVQNMPTVCQIGHRKELQGECQFQESQCHLNAIHPISAFGSSLQPRGEEGEQGEGQGQGKSKAEHANGRADNITRRGYLHQQETNDGTRAGETDQRQGESHEEDGEQTSGTCGLTIHGI